MVEHTKPSPAHNMTQDNTAKRPLNKRQRSSFLEEDSPRGTECVAKRSISVRRSLEEDEENQRLLETSSITDIADRESSFSSSQDSSDEELTSHELKVQLIVDEIDHLGFGRYQWQLFFVCGTGWLLDLLWAHALGVAMPSIQKELGFTDQQYGYLSTGFSIGMTIGALSWGILLDIVGRRSAFNYTVAISSAFGICMGFANSYPLLVFLACGVGIGVGGNIPVDTTIFLEFVPKKDRKMLVVMSIFQPLGSILSTVIAWATIPRYSCAANLASCRIVESGGECCSSDQNMGWRYMFYVTSAITVTIFALRFVVFTMLESPAFLTSHGKDDAAFHVLEQVARKNGTDMCLSYEQFRDAGQSTADSGEQDNHKVASESNAGVIGSALKQMLPDLRHLALLFRDTRTTRLSLLTWTIYAADFWGFTLAGVFLPKILLQKGATQNTSVSETYMHYVIIACAGIPGALLSMVVVQQGFGRRKTMVVSSALMACSLFLFALVSSKVGNVVFNCVEFFCQTVFNAVLYAWTPEAFESAVRGSATGIAAFWGRLISILAPIIGSVIFASGSGGNQVLFAAGGGTLIATLCILLLP